ncbi:tRNA (adenosine(37)-N6)-threonylcarbamoyltransferase complex ATPase subunit type 1 TsaE [Winogradskyella sp. PG-2]|uniref:tRNA (adenosine(37)-N6)-threonylcarbamoyltransferase complex ATPase subunit type 1 TsaE n=1 Tax=Winogradskyella sp. PG-2 TaxID=754409 RepID=UPI00045864E9|nr:tRNA (adenosine(37)-N6)-threonylcarbamoyltransferase complex ATPase subunit type 1 TsaE [Winogradskyella sp. PG-2]BAO77439.1 ATPase YjeE [Winogradskyella sp. PG-2]
MIIVKAIEFTYNLENIDYIASSVLEHLNSKIILFYGEMGAGKTTFINALLKEMHSEDTATSPTFSIVNEYKLLNDKVYHFDFYRIESIDEAYNLGIEDYFNTNNWMFIEWPERVKELLPENAQTITIEDLNVNKRSLKLTIETENLTKTIAMTEPKF